MCSRLTWGLIHMKKMEFTTCWCVRVRFIKLGLILYWILDRTDRQSWWRQETEIHSEWVPKSLQHTHFKSSHLGAVQNLNVQNRNESQCACFWSMRRNQWKPTKAWEENMAHNKPGIEPLAMTRPACPFPSLSSPHLITYWCTLLFSCLWLLIVHNSCSSFLRKYLNLCEGVEVICCR